MPAHVTWHAYASREAMIAGVVAEVTRCIEESVAARGRATLALSGGKTPVAILERLAALDLPWEAVTLMPSDDRIVPITDPLSNAGMLARVFSSTAARVLPLVGATDGYRTVGVQADEMLHAQPWPLDLVWLGMGADGHTASVFPGPDYAAALDAASGRRAVGVRPEPLPPEAPVDRVTLTAPAIATARRCILVMEGDTKRRVLDTALAEGERSAYPIAHVLQQCNGEVPVHWLAG